MAVIRSKNYPLAPKDRKWDARAAEARIREWAGGPDKDNTDWNKYKSCFLWYDEDDPENFTSYKFPYVDIIDGEPHVVFRALAAIIAVLNGARGGANIPASDKEGVYREAAKQYRRFDEEPPELKRSSQSSYERRAFPLMEVRINEEGDKPKIVGYAAVFNKMSLDLGGFREVIRPGAFKKTIQEADVRALWNHNADYVLGRTKSGTLKLEEDDKGLRIEITPPDTQWAKDLITSMRRGDVDQMSFGFRPVKDRWGTEDGENIRELLEVELFDVSPVTFPAYPQTSVQVRSIFAEAGLDYEALSAAIVRAQRGICLTNSDKEVIKTSIDILRSFIDEPRQGLHSSNEPEEGPQGRLKLLKRRLELIEKIL